MNYCELKVKNISFSYGKEKIIKELNFEAKKEDVIVIKGPNGSGKSTLIKLLSDILTIEKGRIEYFINEDGLNPSQYPFYFGLCTVEQNLYEELTIYENLEFLLKLRWMKGKEKIEDYLKKANLYDKRDKYYKNLSSGMKQRVKIISAILHKPTFLFLDEPGSNLDGNGFLFLNQIIEEQKERGICVIASNNEKEYKYGNKTVFLPS